MEAGGCPLRVMTACAASRGRLFLLQLAHLSSQAAQDIPPRKRGFLAGSLQQDGFPGPALHFHQLQFSHRALRLSKQLRDKFDRRVQEFGQQGKQDLVRIALDKGRL
ncbi:hypothetical protein B4Q13_15230, partial [Lacticaseibacillus rhamnosus]